MRKRELEREGISDSGIGVMTKEMKEMSGENVRYVRDFSGGCSGLKKFKIEGKKKEVVK